MGLRDALRRLRREAEGPLVEIPQLDGSVARFPASALEEAFLRNVDFLHARADGDDPPEPHPLQLALRNAAHPAPWHVTYIDMLEDPGEVDDLSEP